MPGPTCTVGDVAMFEDGPRHVTSGSPSHTRRCQNAAIVTSSIDSGVVTGGEIGEHNRCQPASVVGSSCIHPEDGVGVLTTGGPNSSICGVNRPNYHHCHRCLRDPDKSKEGLDFNKCRTCHNEDMNNHP